VRATETGARRLPGVGVDVGRVVFAATFVRADRGPAGSLRAGSRLEAARWSAFWLVVVPFELCRRWDEPGCVWRASFRVLAGDAFGVGREGGGALTGLAACRVVWARAGSALSNNNPVTIPLTTIRQTSQRC
jgi:hypothetical protein